MSDNDDRTWRERIAQYFTWEWRILRRGCADTWRVIKGDVLRWVGVGVAALVLVGLVIAYGLEETVNREVGRSLVIMFTASLTVLVIVFLYQLFLAPYREWISVAAQLQEATFPDIDVTADKYPVLFCTKDDDGEERRYIILRNVTIVSREAPVSLDWRMRLIPDTHKHGLILEDPCRSPVIEWEEWFRGRGNDPGQALTPPRDYPRPGSKNGYIAFELDSEPLISSQILHLDVDDPPEVEVVLILDEKQSQASKEFTIEKKLDPEDFRETTY